MKLVNLTPHPFIIVNENGDVILELPRCEEPPRASEEREVECRISLFSDCGYQDNYDSDDLIKVNKVSLGKVSGLPQPKDGIGYIVSRIIAEACPGRNDLYIPDETVRDKKGRIIGCRALAQI